MWTTLFLTIGLFGVALLIMAVGVIVGGTSIKGSCRGKGKEYACDACGNGEQECVRKENPLTAPLRLFFGGAVKEKEESGE